MYKEDSNHMEDGTFDVIVVGSGAGAMLSACRAVDHGLSVLVIEKADRYGGTSAISGGAIWIPNNDQMAAAGVEDSPEEALTYLKACTRDEVSESRLRAYLDNAPKLVRYLTKKTYARYVPNPYYADYYQHLPGAKPGARTMDIDQFDASDLGWQFSRLRDQSPSTLMLGRYAMTTPEAVQLMGRTPGWKWLAAKIILKYWCDVHWRLKTRRDRKLTFGNALVAALRRSMQDRDIPLWLNTAMQSLLLENGRVVGVKASREGHVINLRAKHGVILAAGGFERNQAMREKHLPGPTRAEWTAAPPINTGDAICAGMDIGAQTAMMNHAWFCPTLGVPGEEKQRGIFAERSMPGCMAVNAKGERFVNESAPYLDFVYAMYDSQNKSNDAVPCYLIFDSAFRRKYPMGPLMPGSVMPDRKLPQEWFGNFLWRADSLDELAGLINVDAEGLASSVVRMNSFARSGVDEDFGRGSSEFDRFYSDPSVKPNPNLALISEGPFYAVRFDAGDIGTKGGLLTDERARVVDEEGESIPGLYCIGNSSASVMGASYPGAGGTLGPAMTFGFIAADQIAVTAAEQHKEPANA
ncbi:MAG: FAD-dependent oxidoreductase [Pseudomonas sp.]